MKAVLLAATLAVLGPSTVLPCSAAFATSACCKVCSKGKACGDSCIARDKQCH